MAHALDLLVHKLTSLGPLDEADREAILALPHTLKTVPRGANLLREGDRPTQCTVLVSGSAFRYKVAISGERQIVSLHIPGEALDFQSLYLDHLDHNAQTLSEASIANIPMDALRQLLADRPAVARAVTHNLLVEASILREWLLNVGRRPAQARIAHLLCEYAIRLDAMGLVQRNGYELLMTQEQIGDALGLTAIHINRSIRALEAAKLIARKGRVISFPNVERLKAVAEFNDLYLHLPRP